MIEKIQLTRKKLENSSFYGEFMEQMQDLDLVTRIDNVIGTDPHYA
jgi:hypothetical protein